MPDARPNQRQRCRFGLLRAQMIGRLLVNHSSLRPSRAGLRRARHRVQASGSHAEAPKRSVDNTVARAGLLVISRSGMSSHWRLITSKRRVNGPVKTFCTVSRAHLRRAVDPGASAAPAGLTARARPRPGPREARGEPCQVVHRTLSGHVGYQFPRLKTTLPIPD